MSDLVEDRFHDCSGQQYPSTNDYRTNRSVGAGENWLDSPARFFCALLPAIPLIGFRLTSPGSSSGTVLQEQISSVAERLDTFADESVA